MSLGLTVPAPDSPPRNPVGNAIYAIEKELVFLAGASLVARQPAQLIAVSKQQVGGVIRQALDSGHRHFGENRVQEATGKWPALKAAYPDVVLHLIGSLQSNKAAEAVSLFDVIHSIDRDSVARAVKAASVVQGRDPACLIQVNTGAEPQKSGVMSAEAGAFIRHCREVVGLAVTGLMCIPPADQNPAPHFALLHQLAQAHGVAELSMGMSGDYPSAASLGATYVRVGTAIFGARA